MINNINQPHHEKHNKKRRKPFSVVPDAILTDRELSFPARITLAYLIGRPEGWNYHVWHICKQLGLTQSAWKKARRELEQCGYMRQTRKKDDTGRFVWSLDVSEIPHIIDSYSIDQKTMDASPIDGHMADIPRGLKQKESNKVDSSSVVLDKLLIIENDADAILTSAIFEEYGADKVRQAATAIIESGARPYPSAVKKHLTKIIKKTEIDERDESIRRNQKLLFDQKSCEKGERFIKSIRSKNKVPG